MPTLSNGTERPYAPLLELFIIYSLLVIKLLFVTYFY